MKLRDALRTIDLARSVGMSVQQVRNYEAQGLLPPVVRSESGYRLYTQQHLAALKTARCLVGGYGWQRVPLIMSSLHQGNLATSLATIDAQHAWLSRKRQECEQTLSALRTLATQNTAEPDALRPQRLRVGEAASRVGVRVSAIHFWEQQGLLQPIREKGSRYRLYDEQQMQRLRVIVLLREAGYTFPVIRSVLDELEAGRPERAIVAVEKRYEELTKASWRCIDGLACFQQYVREFYSHLLE